MASAVASPLEYGPCKYAALHLILSRWLRHYSKPGVDYIYVTLGGTELRDIQSLRFIDPHLARKVVSYEENRGRFEFAKKTAATFQKLEVDVEIVRGSFYEYKRSENFPHIFFLDLLGICAWGDYAEELGNMFQEEAIKEGDCLLITSHLGHNPGLNAIRNTFSIELAMLGIDKQDKQAVRNTFRRAHPAFTLYKGLSEKGLTAQLKLVCLGCIKYKDNKRSPMGLYGYAITDGVTDLKAFVQDIQTQYFDINQVRNCLPTDF